MEETIETNKDNDAYRSQQRVSVLTIISELPNTLILGVLAFLSGSVIMALDTFESLANVVQGALTYKLSKKMLGDSSFRYDFGMGKIDAFGSLVSATILFLGLAAILAVSINALIHPESPSGLLFYAIIIKFINVVIDVYLVYKQNQVVKISNSPMVKSALIFLKKDLLTDAVVLVTVAVAYIFRSYPVIMYFEPVVCIISVMYVAFLNINQVRRATSDLLDKTLDEETQMLILKCVSTIYDDINDFKGVRTRQSGNTIFVDLMVSFDDNKPYKEIYNVQKKFEAAVKDVLPDSVVSIITGAV